MIHQVPKVPSQPSSWRAHPRSPGSSGNLRWAVGCCRNLLGLSKHVHPDIGSFSILFHDRVIEFYDLYDLFIFVLGRKVTIDILLFLQASCLGPVQHGWWQAALAPLRSLGSYSCGDSLKNMRGQLQQNEIWCTIYVLFWWWITGSLSENGVDDMELRLGPLGSLITPIIGWFSYVFLIFTARLYSFAAGRSSHKQC